MTVMEVEALSPVVTGLTTRRSSPADIAAESVASRRHMRPKAPLSVTVAVQDDGAGIPDLRPMVEKINKLLALPRGWDSYRAEPITVEAAVAMLQILVCVMDRNSLPPQLFPLPDGGLQAEWHVSGSSVEIGVSGDGQSGSALTDGEEEVETEFSLPIARDRLADFRNILAGFSGQAGRVTSR